MVRQLAELVERIKAYNPDLNEDLIVRAYSYAMKKHEKQKRASGDPFFSHPIEVAQILTNYRLDTASIVTALLHDTVEDTSATVDEISGLFGKEIGRLVDGVTKLTKIQIQNIESVQAENFRKLFLAMSEDIRVLLVKLIDRLHNMRTLSFIKDESKRKSIALETMEIYAPLSDRLGMLEVKTELEDLAFSELHSEARSSIVRRLRYLERQGFDLVGSIMDELDEVIEKSNVEAYISGRAKTPYSIWRKMQSKNVSFEQLSDIMAFRVIVNNQRDCYKTLGIIHGAYPSVPGRFKDYISTPKRSGYQSIHTSIIGPKKHRIEIQIRTREMHTVADLGPAAHWNYKAGVNDFEGINYRWLRELLDILDNTQSSQEFLEHTKLEMFHDQVFCFTPKGQLIALPKGASPIDFAYAVHSEIGNTCVGAKVNGRITPLRVILQTGDQVEIITSLGQKPSPQWEAFVITGKARSHIRKRIRIDSNEEYSKLGREILIKVFSNSGYEFNENKLIEALNKFNLDSEDDLFISIGNGNLMARQVINAIYPNNSRHGDNEKFKTVSDDKNSGILNKSIPIRGLTAGIAVHMSECCYPLPGDRIVGILSIGKGAEIHTIDCDTLIKFSDQNERWIDLVWDNDLSNKFFMGRIKLTVVNESGSLGELSSVIAHNGGNISNLKVVSRSQDFWDMNIDIEVKDLKHLLEIIAVLRSIPVIHSIERTKSLEN